MTSKFLGSLLFFVLLVSSKAQSKWPNSKADRPIVILITIDGFPVRALDDPSLPMPTLRKMAKDGAVSKGMIPINPTVTWPNHTTLITGVDASRHHLVANGLLVVPEDGGPIQMESNVDKSILVQAPTLYDIAAEHGLSVGQVDWVAVSGAKNIAWQFAQDPTVDSLVVQDLIHDKLLTPEEVEHFSSKNPAWRDQLWTDAAIDIIKLHTPDLLLVHLLETDTLQHRYAPLTPAAYAAYANVDHCLSRIVAAVDAMGLRDRVNYIVASDHGFAEYRHVVRPNVYLKQKGLDHTGDSLSRTVWIKAEGGDADVFVRGADKTKKILQLAHDLVGMPGVEHVYSNKEAQRFGMPATGTTSQAPDLWLTALPGYAFEDGDNGEFENEVSARGQHGYLNTNPEMFALFVASGPKIKPGMILPNFPNLQVAPTIAHILGLPLPEAQSAALLQILRR
jgi:predicted AlkP superfamily pyrophosphatase or phosphodiesterase